MSSIRRLRCPVLRHDRQASQLLQGLEHLAVLADQHVRIGQDRHVGAAALVEGVDVAVEVGDVEQLLEVVGRDLALVGQRLLARGCGVRRSSASSSSVVVVGLLAVGGPRRRRPRSSPSPSASSGSRPTASASPSSTSSRHRLVDGLDGLHSLRLLGRARLLRSWRSWSVRSGVSCAWRGLLRRWRCWTCCRRHDLLALGSSGASMAGFTGARRWSAGRVPWRATLVGSPVGGRLARRSIQALADDLVRVLALGAHPLLPVDVGRGVRGRVVVDQDVLLAERPQVRGEPVDHHADRDRDAGEQVDHREHVQHHLLLLRHRVR